MYPRGCGGVANGDLEVARRFLADGAAALVDELLFFIILYR